jgi:6-pyruvoyl-tetrahydropterin synthase
MPVIATWREAFTAGHRLYIPAFSNDRNREVFGKCNNPSGHGHHYVLKVSVTGPIDPHTGYVFDLTCSPSSSGGSSSTRLTTGTSTPTSSGSVA